MRRRMTQNVQAFKRLRQNRLDDYGRAVLVFRKGVGEVNFTTIHARGERLLGEITVELLQRFPDGDRSCDDCGRSVIKLYVKLAHLLSGSTFLLIVSRLLRLCR